MQETSNRKNKIIIILILISLIIPISALQILAVSTKLDLLPNKTTVARGETVTITVRSKNVDGINGGINSYVGTLGYETTHLSYESSASAVDGWMLTYNQTSKGIIGYDPTGQDFKTSDFDVFTLNFKVLDSAPLGDTKVSLKDVDVADSTGNAHILLDSEVTLTIVEPQKPDPKPDPKSSNNKLKDLNVSEGKLSPDFSSENSNYTVEVDYDTYKITITGNTEDSKAKINTGLGNHDLKEGNNRIVITVEAEDGSKKDYVINVTRKPKPGEPVVPESSDNNLKDLNVSDGTLSPKFSQDNTNYEVEVDFETDKITIDGITNDENAIISGGIGEHELKEGNNRIVVTVIADDGTSKDYIVNVFRKPKPTIPEEKPAPEKPQTSNPDLNINIDNSSSNNYVLDVQGLGQLDREFTKNNNNYISTVGRETSKIDPVVTLEDEDATYRLIGADNLKIGKNIVILEVTAANGEVREYEFEIYRSEEENNALLANLQVGGYAFNPGFREDVNYYTLSVGSDVSTLGVSASPKFGGSLVNIVGHEKLNYGVNYIKVSVNGDNMMNTYMVEVIREYEKASANILPWIISGVSFVVILMLLMVLYFTNKMEKKVNERIMQEMYYNQGRNDYRGYKQPFNQGSSEGNVNPSMQNGEDDIYEHIVKNSDTNDLSKPYSFYREIDENGKKTVRKYKIVEEL